VATGYGAGIAQAPFSTDPGRAADEINQSISDTTRGHITHLVTPDMLTDIGWVLTSALYMNAAWETPFEPSETVPGPFTLADGHKVTAKYMGDIDFPFASADGWGAISLPYKGDKLAMIALLPPSGSAACALPSLAAVRTVTATLNASAGGYALAQLPKASLRTGGSTGDMKAVLVRLGMGLAFTDGADFTGLSTQACCIKFVRQAATLQVGEKGTVASAAAAVGAMPLSAPVAPQRILFNRPFLMLVTDTATGEPLFLAKVADPTTS
jgi:serpin B